MNALNLNANFHAAGRRDLRDYSPGDDFYQALIDTHRGLSDQESLDLNARLILLLSNHIGDLEVLHQALQIAREAGGKPAAA